MSRFTLHHGDSREVLKGLAEASVDSVVCDPPYELGFMGKAWDGTGKAAMLEGFDFIGIDLSAEYLEIARARIDFALRQGHQPSLLEAA